MAGLTLARCWVAALWRLIATPRQESSMKLSLCWAHDTFSMLLLIYLTITLMLFLNLPLVCRMVSSRIWSTYWVVTMSATKMLTYISCIYSTILTNLYLIQNQHFIRINNADICILKKCTEIYILLGPTAHMTSTINLNACICYSTYPITNLSPWHQPQK